MDPIKDAVELSEAQEKPVPAFRTVPNELVRHMPVQDLGRWEGHRREKQIPSHPSARFRRSLIMLATLVITAAASYEMYNVLSVSGITALQIALLVAFTLNFVWIALPFVSGVAGFAVLLGSRTASGLVIPPIQPTPMLSTRTALLMPIYNEEPYLVGEFGVIFMRAREGRIDFLVERLVPSGLSLENLVVLYLPFMQIMAEHLLKADRHP